MPTLRVFGKALKIRIKIMKIFYKVIMPNFYAMPKTNGFGAKKDRQFQNGTLKSDELLVLSAKQSNDE